MGTLTFVKTMAVFSTVGHVLLYTAIYDFVYQMSHIFPALRGQCKKFKTWYICPVLTPPCGALGAWLNQTGILYLLGKRAKLQQKADA